MKKSKIESLLKEALNHHQNLDFINARKIYEKIIHKDPSHFDGYKLLATLEAQNNNISLASALFLKAYKINSKDKSLLNNMGGVAQIEKKYDSAINYLNQALAIDPLYYDALYNLGSVYQDLNKNNDAFAIYEKAIQINKTDFRSFNNLGIVLINLANYEKALENFRKALDLQPQNAEVLNNIGKLFLVQKKYQEALDCFSQSISLNNQLIEPFLNLAESLKKLGNYDIALQTYDAAINLNIANAKTYFSKAQLLEEIELYPQALANYEKSIQLDPVVAGIHLNKGNVLKKMRKYEDALASYEQAKLIDPKYSEAFSNAGAVYHDLQDYDKSIEQYGLAISLNANNGDAYFNRGNTRKEMKDFKGSLEDLNRALLLNPSFDYLIGDMLYSKMYIAQWQDVDFTLNRLAQKIISSQRASTPFPCVTLLDLPEIHYLVAKIYSEDKAKPNAALGPLEKREPKSKIKIGYYSSDFYNHATAYLMAEMFELHDKNKFEIIGMSFGPHTNDEMQNRLTVAFDQIYQVNHLSDLEIAHLSRDIQIDIAIDLKGYTQGSRPGIFAHRAAPLQVNYLGYPGTMSAPYIDYLIADKNIIPEDSQQFYSEKIVYLPNCYQVNDSNRKVGNLPITKKILGLPEEGFIFCSFNGGYKITPKMYTTWMKILSRVPNSILWLLKENEDAIVNLRAEAKKRGVDESRIIFAPRQQIADHLQRYYFADLFLDTFPCNAHTTASDAIWCDLPLVTYTGKGFASRVSASILDAMGLNELITDSFDEFEEKAVELASNQSKLDELKNKLIQNKKTSTLFNPKLFTKNLERAYMVMFDRYLNNLPTEHLNIETL